MKSGRESASGWPVLNGRCRNTDGAEWGVVASVGSESADSD